jgi:hypothetical protein
MGIVDAIERLMPRLKREKAGPAPDRLARQWGRLNFQSVVRYVPKTPVFVHCHECRWPVNARRTHMGMGPDSLLPATNEQMGRICLGVRKHMGVA